MRQQRAYDKYVRDRATAVQAQRHIDAQNRADQERQFQEYVQAQQERLLELVPEWKDDEKRKSDAKDLQQWMTQHAGYSKEEVGQIYDARALATLRKAMLYDRAVEQANAAKKQVQSLPTRVQRPGPSDSIRATDGRTAAMQSLRKSGSTDAAAAVFEKMI